MPGEFTEYKVYLHFNVPVPDGVLTKEVLQQCFDHIDQGKDVTIFRDKSQTAKLSLYLDDKCKDIVNGVPQKIPSTLLLEVYTETGSVDEAMLVAQLQIMRQIEGWFELDPYNDGYFPGWEIVEV